MDLLQEYCKLQRHALPHIFLRSEGRDHAKVFFASCEELLIPEQAAKTKKDATRLCAVEVLKVLKQLQTPNTPRTDSLKTAEIKLEVSPIEQKQLEYYNAVVTPQNALQVFHQHFQRWGLATPTIEYMSTGPSHTPVWTASSSCLANESFVDARKSDAGAACATRYLLSLGFATECENRKPLPRFCVDAKAIFINTLPSFDGESWKGPEAFDIEWHPYDRTFKCAAIARSPNEVYIYTTIALLETHLQHMSRARSRCLVFGAEQDRKFFPQFFDILSDLVIDVQHILPKNVFAQKAGLAQMTRVFCKQHLEKGSLSLSFLNEALTIEQLQYVAADAVATLLVFQAHLIQNPI